MKKRVVITGLGAITPLGTGRQKNWEKALEGKSGIRRITIFDPSPYPTQVAGEVPDFDPTAFMDSKMLKRMDTFIQYALVASLMAMEDAGLAPEEVDYINAHGTSTPYNDKCETLAIKKVFRDHAYKLAISSNKSMIGHLMGASGGVEALFTILTLYHDIIPPTINYDHPDPDCDLDYVPNVARPQTVNVALSNSFGFGGVNGTLVFKKYE